MSELNKLLYQTIKNDPEFKTLTGGAVQDPRIYKRKTPVKLEISDIKRSFVVYYIAGTTKVGSPKIEIAQRNNKTYGLEVYGKKDTDVEQIAERIERLFYEEQFLTDSYRIGYTYATRGRVDFDEDRKLYTETMFVFFTKILALNLAS